MRPPKFELGDMLLVTWDDILQDPTWQSMDSLDNSAPSEVKTIGFFLRTYRHKRRYVLLLASNISEDGDTDTLSIPYGVIRQIEKLQIRG